MCSVSLTYNVCSCYLKSGKVLRNHALDRLHATVVTPIENVAELILNKSLKIPKKITVQPNCHITLFILHPRKLLNEMFFF